MRVRKRCRDAEQTVSKAVIQDLGAERIYGDGSAGEPDAETLERLSA